MFLNISSKLFRGSPDRQSGTSQVEAIAARRAKLSAEPAPFEVEDALHMSRARAAELAEALAAPPEPTNSSADGTALRSVVIGAVPDRGGQARKTRPGKRDLMPEWTQRKEGEPKAKGKGGRGGRGRGRGGGRGGGGGGKGGGGKKKKKGGRGGGGKGAKPAKAA